MASSNPRRVDFPEGIPVALRFFLVSGKGTILNLSSTGAYIATPMYLLPQAGVRLKIVLREEKRWFETDAVVVWENRGTVGRRDGLPPGYGFRFVDPSEDARQAIEKLVAGEAVRPAEQELEPEADPEPVSVARDDEPDTPPFRLRRDVVRQKTPARASGIFVLSYDRRQEARVGRADEDLRATLATFEGKYAYFYFEAIDPSDERYFRECELYHRLGGDRGQLDNTVHPVPPKGLEVDCPVCVAAKSVTR
jgi:hypothetical protein